MMDNDSTPEGEAVVDYLLQMFPGTVDRDVIAAVVESCAGDLDHSTDALLTMISDNHYQVTSSDAMASNLPHSTQHEQSTISYAAASKKVSVVKQYNESRYSSQEDRKDSQNMEQLKNIIYYYNKGYKILILMRGLPGCGKSYLAKRIIDETIGPDSLEYKKHVFSTDDFFVNNRGYCYNSYSIPQAHNWNQDRVRQAINSGLSPIIVDNTNVELWEMEVYVREGAREGYIIEILEPQTSWTRNSFVLAKRNIHGVPLNKIKAMAAKYERHVTTSSIMKKYRITYPANKKPPQMRSLPVFKDNFTHNCFLPSNMSSTSQSEQVTTSPVFKYITANKPILNGNLQSFNEARRQLLLNNYDHSEGYNKQDYANSVNNRSGEHCYDTHDCFLPTNMSSKVNEQLTVINVRKPQIPQSEQTATDIVSTHIQYLVNKPILNDNLESCVDNYISNAQLPLDETFTRHNDDLAESYNEKDDANSANDRPMEHSYNTHYCYSPSNTSSEVNEQQTIINVRKPQIQLSEQTTMGPVSNHIQYSVNKPMLNDNLESCNYISDAQIPLDKTSSCCNDDLAEIYTKQDDANPRLEQHCCNTDTALEKCNKRKGNLSLSRESSMEEFMINFSDSEPWEVEAERKSNELSENFEVIAPKPKRVYKKRERRVQEKMLPSEVNEWEEWNSLDKYIPSWNYEQPSTSTFKPTSTVVTEEKQTSVDPNNFKNYDNFKCLTGVSRDINIDYNFREETEIKIPKKLMLDKSSSTHQRISLNLKTTSEDIHYQENNTLNEEIFDFCDGCEGCNNNIDWSINFFIDNNNNDVEIHLDYNHEDLSKPYNSPCICASNYIRRITTLLTNANKIKNNTDTIAPSQQQRKRKKWKNSTSGSKLKEEIEKGFVIGGYSKHKQPVKTNNVQHNDTANNNTANDNFGNNIKHRHDSDTSASDISAMKFEEIEAQGANNNETSRDESYDTTPELSVSEDDSSEENVTVMLGNEFIKNIDDKFGRSNFNYPVDIKPVVAMSKTVLEEINALWVESLSHQLSCMAISPEVLQKEDEDLAKVLTEIEEEYELKGMVPNVPDLADIMDMESALHLQNEEEPTDVRNNMPNDMASVLTRNKLYNLFPDQDQDDLLEIFAAHNNNFLVTTEVLLTTMGRNDIVEEEDGVRKFIYKAELERQSKNLAVEKQRIRQEHEASKETDLTAYNQYRSKANAHLKVRNRNMIKARDLGGRGMTGMATFYESVALYHKSQYEHANGLAISSLVDHMETATTSTIDLHYMYVDEALNFLDVFLDEQIADLRAGPPKNWTTGVKVFVITGRGRHSVRRTPKIKPAVLERFSTRDLESFELNPGLLGVVLYATSLMTDEVTRLQNQAEISGGDLRQMIADYRRTM